MSKLDKHSVYKCDTCGFEDVNIIFAQYAKHPHWYEVNTYWMYLETGANVIPSTEHFCSENCLVEWLNRKR